MTYGKTAKDIANQLVACFKRGNKCLIFGNGGSLADASHFAAEFHSIGPVIALNDPAKITSIGNDYHFNNIFSLQIVTTGKEGDIAIGLSSSGESENVNLALKCAKVYGMKVIDFPRQGNTTQEVQEFQYGLLHQIYLEVKELYKNT